MIYTVTFNPALDYVIGLEDLTKGEINRTKTEAIYYGGKGINVSRILNRLKVKSKTLGFVAGFTGHRIEAALGEEGIETDFITLKEGFSRINVKIKAGEETEINGQGPHITKEALEQLFNQINELKEEDVLVLAGSIPNTLPQEVYEQIMASISHKKVKVVVDATRDLLVNVLKYHPFLIKPNNHELGEIFNKVLTSDEEIIECAKKLQEQGAQNVLVSMAKDGAILVTQQGEVYKMGVPKGTVVNSVGAGDSMVAGFIAGYMVEGSFKNALKLGTAAGSATAFTSDLATYEQIMTQFNSL